MKKTNTKSLLIVLFICLVGISQSFAQPGVGIQYGFSTTTTVPAFTPNYSAVVNGASLQDNSMVILAPTAYTFPFAGTNYPFFLTSTNGWTALLPASDLSAVAVSTTSNATSLINTFVLNLTSTAGVANGMYVSGPGILGGQGYAFVVSFTATTVTLNVGFTTAVAVGATYNFFNLLNGSFNSTLPTNILSTYALGRPLIAPLWDDLATTIFSVNFTGLNYNIRWSAKWGTGGASGESFNVNFNNSTGFINFNYPAGAYTPVAPSASIGIAGVCAGDYYFATPTAAATATVDSAIADPANVATRPVGVAYIWNPISKNDNCSGSFPAKDLLTINSTCTYQTFSNVNASTSGTNICATTDNKDVWFKFTKPVGVSNLKITTIAGSCTPAPGTTLEVFSSCGGTSLGCATTSSANPGFAEIKINRPCSLEVLYVRVTVDGDVVGKFQICVTDQGNNVSGISNGTDCSTATTICGLPFSQSGLTTAGYGNDYDSANAQCHDPYLNGEDYVFSYTPTANICVQIQLTSTGTNPSVFIYDGCPNSGLTHCIANVAGITGIIRINSVTLIAGVTYYFVVDNNPLNATNNIPFDISITQLGTSNTYDACATYFNLGTIANNTACSYGTYSTECASPSLIPGYPTPTCGNFIDGVTGDVWLAFTASFTGSLLVKTQPSSVNPTADAAMAIYTGSCGAFTLLACDDNSAGNSLPLLSIPVTSGTSYYIRIWTVNPANTGNFDLCLSSACSPPNDLPCASVYIPLGGTAAGFNTCSGGNNEPPNAAQCVVGGIVNTVWYKAVVPAGGSIRIRTHPLTLTDTQIQAFTFTSGCANASTIYTSKGCNDDGPDCGTQNNQSYHDYSELTISGQTPGDTIFIAVDGYNSMTGSFEITVVDGATVSYAPVYLQDCDFPYEVCGATNIVVPDPGPLNFGNICDFSPTYDCWQNGERNSIWYRVTVNPGTLQFAVNSVTDYDFIMWDVTGVANACASIQTHSLPSIRCNWVTTTGQTGISIPDPNASWEPAITSAGIRTYLILIDNWNPPNFVTGFTLDWMGSPIASNPTSVTWNGGVDTMFSSTSNWGTAPCNALPSCTIDAIITASASGRQPTMSSNTQVKNLTINSGASLRIKSGVTVDVCGDFTNNGTFIAEPGSTVRFSGTTTQLITGNLIGSNSFANLTIFKATGQVNLISNIDVSQTFSTVSATSIFNINGKYMRVGRDFLNNNANVTFTGIGNSNLEFNGTLNQYFTNTTGTLTLNRVRMSKTSGKLYLIGANSKMNIDSVLTLAQGIINTRSNAALEVNVKHNLTSAIIGHNALSYIDGKLRRSVYNNLVTTTNSVAVAAGATSFTVTSTAGLAVNMYVSGPGILSNTIQITAIAGNVITVNSTFTAAVAIGATYSFGNLLPSTAIGLPFSLDFPVGDSLTPGGYELANVTFSSGTVIPSLLASFDPWPGMTPPSLGPTASECLYATYDALAMFNHGYWSFSKLAPSPFNGVYKMTLFNSGQSNNTGMGWTVAKADVAANPSLTASWGLIGQCVITSTAGNTQRVNINSPATTATSFNALFTTVQSTQPLPIELLYFTAEPEGENVLCQWETASETNNDYFEVQRSVDGEEWETIGTVRGYGAGISTVNHYYKLIDSERCKGIRYYRLRQVDIDDHFGFSETVAVNCKDGINDISVYPNPGSENIVITFYESAKGEAIIEFVDMLGKIVRTDLVSTQKGFNSIHSTVNDLAGGVYYLRIKTAKNPAQTDRQIRFVKD